MDLDSPSLLFLCVRCLGGRGSMYVRRTRPRKTQQTYDRLYLLFLVRQLLQLENRDFLATATSFAPQAAFSILAAIIFALLPRDTALLGEPIKIGTASTPPNRPVSRLRTTTP